MDAASSHLLTLVETLTESPYRMPSMQYDKSINFGSKVLVYIFNE